MNPCKSNKDLIKPVFNKQKKWIAIKGMLRISGFLLVFLSMFNQATAQYSFENTSVREVISTAEKNTPFQFLYRDALIAGIHISFYSENDEAFFSDFEQALETHGISLRMDEKRYQVFLFQDNETQRMNMISGRIVDAQSGTSLPFATLSWHENGQLTGVASNEDGYFRFPMPRSERSVRVDFIGYQSVNFTVGSEVTMTELTIRMQPMGFMFNPVVIVGSDYANRGDSLSRQLTFEAGMMQFGGNQAIRSLTRLPSVNLLGAFSNGLHVRGNKTDAFDVQLDGMTIFGPSHFFGLFDAFNPDALRAVGFYYSVTPATLSGPPGATLSFLTRSGSQQEIRGRAGISNTAVRGTLEGPVNDGKGSWLISGRYSLMSQMDWMNNDKLIRWGLDADRPNSQPAVNGRLNVLTPTDYNSDFYDIHATGFYEFERGYRLSISGYAGANRADLDSDRFFRAAINPGAVFPGIETRTVTTKHQWGNEAVSIRLQHPILKDAYLSTNAGFSQYRMQFNKDDFLYYRSAANSGQLQSFIDFFGNENELTNFRLNQTADFFTEQGILITVGHTLQQHRIRYAENNSFEPFYDQTRFAWQWDHFIQAEMPLSSVNRVNAGLRTHYFSDGGYAKLSPRIEWNWQPYTELGFMAGLSRNYQFLHSLTLNNYTMSEFWVMTSESNEPSSSNNITAGFWLQPFENHFFQIEGYFKNFENLRLPKINARSLITDVDFENTPWFNRNNSWAKGIELMYKATLTDWINVTNTYTLSVSELQNDLINNGERYFAEWDRTHQYAVTADVAFSDRVNLNLSWMYASGAFNIFSLNNAREPERLDDYHRMDAGLSIMHQIESVDIELKLGVYNVYDQQNTMYRTPAFFVQTSPRPQLQNQTVNVYDLGFMPLFDISIRF